MRQDLAIKNLRDVKEILDRSGVRYWLDYGTLIGAVREGKLLPWDEDIDLGTLSRSLDHIVSTIPEFQEKGFNVSSTKYSLKFERYNIPVDLSINYIYGEYAGIVWMKPISFPSKVLKVIRNALAYKLYIRPKMELIFSLVKDLIFSRGSLSEREHARLFHAIFAYFFSFLPNSLRKVLFDFVSSLAERTGIEFYPVLVPKHHYKKRLGCIELYGMKFNIPSETNSYLELRYGKNWKIPRKDWDPYRDDGAVMYNKDRFKR